MLFNSAVIINLIVAFFYPFANSSDSIGSASNSTQQSQSLSSTVDDSNLARFIWAAMLMCAAVALALPKPATVRALVLSIIACLICSVGPQPTLVLLGTLTVCLKCIHLVSIMGNSGMFGRSVRQAVADTELLYHVVYLVFCLLGLVTHPFFFSVLLFDVVYREDTLLNVMRSVTRNGRSIVLTAVLALILVYMFSIIG